MNNYDYAIGSDNGEAPWNKEQQPKKVSVTVSMTISKDVEVELWDYEYDDEGNIEYSPTDLEEAVQNQIYLPVEVSEIIRSKLTNIELDSIKEILDDTSNWNVDEFEVIPD